MGQFLFFLKLFVKIQFSKISWYYIKLCAFAVNAVSNFANHCFVHFYICQIKVDKLHFNLYFPPVCTNNIQIVGKYIHKVVKTFE